MKNIAVLGCGVIASIMARTLREMQKRGTPICLYAAAARSLERAQAFCEKEGFEKAYGSYEELARDPKVDLIYIATPHSHHAEQAKLCIENGKAILCEKAFTANAQQAREVLALAKQKNVLVAEAIWPRYMPSAEVIRRALSSGMIGKPQLLTANLSGFAEDIARIYDPALAGGALLDVGIYPLTFCSMFFGDDFTRIDSSVDMMSTGVDRQEMLTVHYPDGRMAVLFAGVSAPYPKVCTICCTEGYLTVDYCANPRKVIAHRTIDGVPYEQNLALPEQISGYEYEVESCLRALDEGRIECPEMPHSQTIRMMEIMDSIRAKWNMKYPFEQ